MLNVEAAVYAALTSNADVAALLATYADAPAVFTDEDVPGDAPTPYVVVSDAVGSFNRDDKNRRGREELRQIEVYDDRTGSSRAIRVLAETVRDALHRQPLVMEGGKAVLVRVGPPSLLEVGAELRGRVMQLRIVIDESADQFAG